MSAMQRFLVRKATSEVFIWTPELSKIEGLQEVFAENAAEALTKEAMPDPRSITLDQLEGMSKGDLLIFARVKLGLVIPASKNLDEIQNEVKEKLFTTPTEAGDPAVGADVVALKGQLQAALEEGSLQAGKVADLTAELGKMQLELEAAQAEAAKATEELAQANARILELQPKIGTGG